MLCPILLDDVGDNSGDLVGARDCGIHVHHQNGVINRVGEQHFERRGITREVGDHADDIDGV